MSLIHLWSHRGFKEAGWRRPCDSAEDCGMVGCLDCGWNSKLMLNSCTLLLLFGLFVLCPLGMLYKPMWPWMSHDAGASVRDIKYPYAEKRCTAAKWSQPGPVFFVFFFMGRGWCWPDSPFPTQNFRTGQNATYFTFVSQPAIHERR